MHSLLPEETVFDEITFWSFFHRLLFLGFGKMKRLSAKLSPTLPSTPPSSDGCEGDTIVSGQDKVFPLAGKNRF